jgi:hypothetical protein
VTALWLALALPAFASASSSPVLEVRLDPRVELAAALELLGPGPGPAAFRETGPYGKALKNGVSACAAHPAVGAYRGLRASARPDWPAQALVELTRCLDDALEVKPLEPCRRSALAASAADFAASCGFHAALAAAQTHVAAEVKALLDASGDADLLGTFRTYTGLEPGRSRVAPSPLMRPGVFWNGLVPDGDSFRVIVARSPEDGRFPWTGVPVEVWHENGHGRLDGKLPSSSPPSGVDVKGCYESWPQCAREHMAQGLALRLSQGKGRRNPRLPLHAKAAAALAAYEKDRVKYPDLLAFYPTWFAALGAGEGGAEAVATATPGDSAPEPELADALALAAKDEAAGRAALEALVKRRPGDGAALLSLAVLQRRRDKAAAAALADRAVAAGRGAGGWLLPDALSTRAPWKREDGDAAGARRDLEEALASAPLDWPRRGETKAALQPRP